jgi:hypothetical protein
MIYVISCACVARLGWEVLQLGNGVFGVLGKGVLGFGESERGLGLGFLGVWGFGGLVGVSWRCPRPRGEVFIILKRLFFSFMRFCFVFYVIYLDLKRVS